MKVDRELVLRIAKLANIELTDSEIELFTTQLAGILDYMEKLNELEENAEPLRLQQSLTAAMREDVVTPSLSVDDVMKNAPSQKKNLFRVPRIIP